MLEVLFCGYNIFCTFNTVKDAIIPHKYPPEVAELCTFLSTDVQELPNYCKSPSPTFTPKKRNEY